MIRDSFVLWEHQLLVPLKDVLLVNFVQSRQAQVIQEHVEQVIFVHYQVSTNRNAHQAHIVRQQTKELLRVHVMQVTIAYSEQLPGLQLIYQLKAERDALLEPIAPLEVRFSLNANLELLAQLLEHHHLQHVNHAQLESFVTSLSNQLCREIVQLNSIAQLDRLVNLVSPALQAINV